MGPSPESDGNLAVEQAVVPTLTTLQWGRRPRATEIQVFVVVQTNAQPLQWGRRPRATEITPQNRVVRERPQLQWGHRPRATEIQGIRSASVDLLKASMGPSPESDGNAPFPLIFAGVVHMLQWGRRPRATEIW